MPAAAARLRAPLQKRLRPRSGGFALDGSGCGRFQVAPFQGAVILWAVRWYCKYGISYRNLEEMLEERGVDVDHTTIYRWVQLYAPEMEKGLRWYVRIR